MAFAGLRGSGSWGTDERPKSFREGILFWEPNGVAPIFALTSMMSTQVLNDPEHAWWEEKLLPIRLEINDATGYTATSTSITVRAVGLGTLGVKQLGGLAVKAGDLVLVEKAEITSYDNELMEVSSVTSDTVVVFKRGAQGTTATGIGDGTFLTVVGSVYEEGTAAAGITQRNPTKSYNYTQIFKTSVGATKTAEATEARTGDAFKVDKQRKAFDHAAAIELAFMYGRRSEITSGSFPKRSMAGLREQITTNVDLFTAEPTEDQLIDALTPVFDYNGGGANNERLMFCGNGFLNNINRIFRDSSSTRINYDKVAKNIYGMAFTQFVIPQGTFMMKTHPIMTHHSRFTNSAFILNPKALSYMPLKGRDTKFEDNIQTPGKDSHEGQWLTECTLRLMGEHTCGYLTLNY